MSEPQTPPQNLDAEEHVIGSMLLSPHAIATVSEVVKADDFYRGSHGEMFNAALALDQRGEPVDALTLTAELEKRGTLERVGGKVRIHELAALVPTVMNAGHHARIVREVAQRRALIAAGQQISRLGWEGQGELSELMAQAEQSFTEATVSTHAGDFESLSGTMSSLGAQLREAVDSGKPIFGHKTGFHDVDKLLLGLHPGRLYVVAARPGVGKSVWVLNVAENFADAGKPVGFFSLEMSKRELGLRCLCRRTKIDTRNLTTAKLDQHQMKAVEAAIEKMANRPLFVEDNAAISMTELRARARRQKAKTGLDLLVVDYLQLMVTATASKDSRERQVAELSRGLKMLAKELHVPVIMVSQLNRNLEYREDKRPKLADLRESGAIEQDADVVMFLYREEAHRPVEAEKGGDAELIVAKNRHGQTDTIKLLFLARRQTFATPARHTEEGA